MPIEYEIGGEIYQSGDLLVCRGYRLADGRPAVLKILRPETASEEARARFKREFETLSKVSLPGIVKAYGLEDYQGGLMMALEDVGALIGSIIASNCQANDYSVIIENKLIIGEIEFNGHFYLIPSMETISHFIQALNLKYDF